MALKTSAITLTVGLAFAAGPVFAQPAPPPQSGGGGKFFEGADTNGDGAISKAEWDAAGRPPQGFVMMDLNKDGKVTRAEGREAMQRVMQARRMQAGQ